MCDKLQPNGVVTTTASLFLCLPVLLLCLSGSSAPLWQSYDSRKSSERIGEGCCCCCKQSSNHLQRPEEEEGAHSLALCELYSTQLLLPPPPLWLNEPRIGGGGVSFASNRLPETMSNPASGTRDRTVCRPPVVMAAVVVVVVVAMTA